MNRRIVGPALIVVCALHSLVGVVGSWSLLAETVRDGWVGAVTAERSVALWFLMTGFVGVVAGLAVGHLERLGRLPWSVSVSLLVVAFIGVSAAPVSGFLLVLVVALLAVGKSARLHNRGVVTEVVPPGGGGR